MVDASLTCPECAGERLVGPSGEPDTIHPAGILTINHVPGCTLRERDDATRVADYTNAAEHTERNYAGLARGQFKRPITAIELTILTAWLPRMNVIDPERLTRDTMTFVTGITSGIINRSWPSLWSWTVPPYDTLADSERKSRSII